MCWYKPAVKVTSRLISVVLLFNCLSACKPAVKESGASLKYFDLKGYFTKDTARLNKLYNQVDKTVTYNGAAEQKKVKITDWGRELDLFIRSDINKPAWKNSYTVVSNNDFLLYKAKDPDLQTQEMLIKLDKRQVKWMLIYNRDHNLLYTTTEKLTYYPDSLYMISKMQKVRLMGTNFYKIKGVIGR